MTYDAKCARQNKDKVRKSNVKTRKGFVYKLAFLFPGEACKDFLLHHENGSFVPGQTRIVWVEKDANIFPIIEKKIRDLGYEQYGTCDKFASLDVCDENIRGGLNYDYVGFDPCGEITPGMLANLARMSWVTDPAAKVCMTFKFVRNHYTRDFIDLFKYEPVDYEVFAKKTPKMDTVRGLMRSYDAVMKAWSEFYHSEPKVVIYRDTTTWMMNVEFKLQGVKPASEHPEIKTTLLKYKINKGIAMRGYVSEFIEDTQSRIDGLKPRVIKPSKWAWDIFNPNRVQNGNTKISVSR